MNTAGRFKERSLQGGTEVAMITMGLPFILHTRVPYSISFQSPTRSVEWSVEIGFLLQMEKTQQNIFLFCFVFLIKQILDAIARNSEDKA